MQSNRLLTPLSEAVLIDLTAEVKEVLAKEYKKSPQRILSAADLWNIQRQGKARRLRRFI